MLEDKIRERGMMTRAIHSGWRHDPATGASGLPIYVTSAFQFKDTDHAAGLFSLSEEGYIYSRLSNPTVSAFEEGLNSLEGGSGCVSLSSGQSAFTHLIAAICSSGDNLVVSRKIYGGTLTLLQNVFSRFGVRCIFVDGDHPCQVEQAVDGFTRGIVTETIGNPMMNVAPLEALANISKRQGVPLIVDNTFATPALCRPIEWGASAVIHSTTKYISGNGNVIGGAVVDGGTFDWAAYPDKFPGLAKPDPAYNDVIFSDKFGASALYAKLRLALLRDLGGCQSPFDAYLLHLSLRTLPLRMERHSMNAMAVAGFLESHPAVEWVRYPGLSGHPQNDLAKIYLKDGCGGMIAFSLRGGLEAGKKFIDGLDMIGHMANLGDSRTIVIHPASTTHGQLTPQQRRNVGIGEGLIRLSVGIEDSADIIEDLEPALENAGA